MKYISVTEMPGNKASKENLEMLYSRYKWASQFVEGKDVLEVACGAGQGLGYLAKRARKVVGGDIDGEIVKRARHHYKERIRILQFDAGRLPFDSSSFDVIILFESIYYLKNPDKFLEESRRVLRKGGIILLCTVNKDWAGFSPSPFSFKYFSVPELVDLFKRHNFKPEVFGAFPASPTSLKGKVIFFIRQMAVKLQLIPRTMKGKEKLKRIFFGKLFPIPAEIKEGMAEYHSPLPLPLDLPNRQYKVLFVLAKKKDA